MLLIVMGPAEAHSERIMRLLPGARIGGGAQMGELHVSNVTTGNAAIVRPNPSAMARPDFTQGRLHAELWAFSSVGEHRYLLRGISPSSSGFGAFVARAPPLQP